MVAVLAFDGLWACPFRAATGLPCPACGSTRAVRAALAGDFGRSLYLNPLPFLLAGVGAVLLWRAWRTPRAPAPRNLSDRAVLGVVGAVLAYWLAHAGLAAAWPKPELVGPP